MHSPCSPQVNQFASLTKSQTSRAHCPSSCFEECLCVLYYTGNTQRLSNYIVVQKQMESNPVYSGDTATLECSVFSDSENKTCPGDHNVFWFRAGSHPNIIYTDGKRHNEYENRSNPQKRCVYRFSKNVSFSDAGTYYCAVATSLFYSKAGVSNSRPTCHLRPTLPLLAARILM
uniref:Ig-like domain-containing protein n=1 Tax=Maylandia zebra TaxID=106582 RepID=A0A3P9CPC0_9CICH